MADFRLELDAPNNIVLVMVTEDDGSEHDYQFDFDPNTGRWEFAERDILERDFGDDWVDDFEDAVEKMIKGAVEGLRTCHAPLSSSWTASVWGRCLMRPRLDMRGRTP